MGRCLLVGHVDLVKRIQAGAQESLKADVCSCTVGFGERLLQGLQGEHLNVSCDKIRNSAEVSNPKPFTIGCRNNALSASLESVHLIQARDR